MPAPIAVIAPANIPAPTRIAGLANAFKPAAAPFITPAPICPIKFPIPAPALPAPPPPPPPPRRLPRSLPPPNKLPKPPLNALRILGATNNAAIPASTVGLVSAAFNPEPIMSPIFGKKSGGINPSIPFDESPNNAVFKSNCSQVSINFLTFSAALLIVLVNASLCTKFCNIAAKSSALSCIKSNTPELIKAEVKSANNLFIVSPNCFNA